MSEPARLGLHDRLFAYLELVRLPNLFTSMADVTMGFYFARAMAPDARPLLPLVVAASTVLYAAVTTLNDVFDYPVDLEQRPERPIPSGRVSLGAARWLGAAAWVLMSAAWLPGLRFYRRSPLWAPLLPLVAAFYLGATFHSAVSYWRGRGGMWKGRPQARGRQ